MEPPDAPPLESATNISFFPAPSRKTEVVDAVIVGVQRELGACLEPGRPAGVDRRAGWGSCGALTSDGWPVAAMHHPGQLPWRHVAAVHHQSSARPELQPGNQRPHKFSYSQGRELSFSFLLN